MHIALVTPNWPPEKFASGIVTYVNSMRGELLKRGHHVTILTIGTDSGVNDPDVFCPISTLRFKIKVRFMRAIGYSGWMTENWGETIAAVVNRIHKRHPIDVIEMEESFGWCGSVAKLTPIPVVVKLHGPCFLVHSLLNEEDPWLARHIYLEKSGLSKIATVISPSQNTLEDTIARYALHPQFAQRIPNCIIADPNLPIWKMEECDPKSILFVGRFDKIKGADILLKAFRLLLNRDSSLKLIFVGPNDEPIEEDGIQYSSSSYVKHILAVSQQENIEFKGRLSPKEIAQLRVESALTIVSSRWESQSYTALEAMMQGCPVVASNTGGIPEIIHDGVTGRLYDCESPDELAHTILQVLAHLDSSKTMGINARQYVLEKHSTSVVADATFCAYTEAIKSNSRSK